MMSVLATALLALAGVTPLAAINDGDREPVRFEPDHLLGDPALPRRDRRASARPDGDERAPANASPIVGGPMGGGPMGGGGPGYSVEWYPSRALDGQPGRMSLVRQSVSAGAPLARTERGMLMAMFRLDHLGASTDAILPDRGRPFPDELWNVSLGLNYLHRFDRGWTGMLMANVGSASDRPFDSADEITVSLMGMVRIPTANERDAWQLGLMYTNAGQLAFPLPMVSYAWNPSEQLQVNLGLPLSATWRPTDDWRVNLSYVPLYNITALATWEPAERLSLFGGYEAANDAWFLADRADSRDRFFRIEQRLVSGLRWKVSEFGSFEIKGGYSFGRYFGEGQSQWETLRDRVDVAPGPFLGAAHRVRF